MEAKISVKIKVAKGKEITLDADEAKELYMKLKEIFEEKEKVTFVPYRVYDPVYPLGPNTSPFTPWITWWSTTASCDATSNSDLLSVANM